MKKNCDTCAHKQAESRDENDERIVDCEENDLQIYSPWVEDCVHWEKALDQD